MANKFADLGFLPDDKASDSFDFVPEQKIKAAAPVITLPKMEPLSAPVEDFGFVPEQIKPDLRNNELELKLQDMKRQKEQAIIQQDVVAQIQKAAAADPNNWTIEQTKDYFSKNPAKSLTEEAARKNILDQKLDLVKNMTMQLKAAPPKTIRERVNEVIFKPFQMSPEDKKTHATNVMSLAQMYDLPPSKIEENYEQLRKKIVGGEPQSAFGLYLELGKGYIAAPIVAGLAAHPLMTAAGIAGFQALSEIENAVVSKIKNEKYQFLRGREAKDLLPSEASQGTKDFVELLDFIGKGMVLGGMKVRAEGLLQRFTKDVVTNYKLPQKVYLSPEKVSEMSEAEFRSMFQKDLELPKSQLVEVIKARASGKGIQIEIPAEKIVSMVDKPYWAKVKGALNIQKTSRVLTKESAGKPSAGVGVPLLGNEKGSARLPLPDFNMGDLVRVAGQTAKILEISGGQVLLEAAGKKWYAKQEDLDRPVPIKDIQETPLKKLLRKGAEDEVGKDLEKIPESMLRKEPELWNLVQRSKELSKAADSSQLEVNQDVDLVANELKLSEKQHAQKKGFRSIASKVLRKVQDRPDYNFKDLTDYGRGTIIFDDFNAQVEAGIKSLVEKGWIPSPNFGNVGFGGFRIFSLNKESKNGLKVEMQLGNKEIWEKKKNFSDKLYHDNRDLIEKPWFKLTQAEQKKYSAADELGKKEWASIYETLDVDRASMAATSSGVKRTASRISEPPPSLETAGLQDPSSPKTWTGQDLKSTTLPSSNLSTKSDIVSAPPEKSLSQKTENVKKNVANKEESTFFDYEDIGMIQNLVEAEMTKLLGELKNDERILTARMKGKKWDQVRGRDKELLDNIREKLSQYRRFVEPGLKEEAEKGIEKNQHGGIHKAPTREFSDIYGALHEMDKTYPDDIYTSPDAWRYYGHGTTTDAPMDKESLRIIRLVKGDPSAEVIIYRSVPKGKQKEINDGDWVTINRQYAAQHGKRFEEGQDIISKKVKASEIFTEGNSIHEFGYSPLPDPVKIAPDVKDDISEEALGFDEEISSFDQPLIEKVEATYDALPPEEQAKYELELDDLRKTPEGNLLLAIDRLGGIAPHDNPKLPGSLAEEYRDLPNRVKNKNSSQKLDTIIESLKDYGWVFEDSNEMRAAILHAYHNPIGKVSRASLREVIRQAEKNKKAAAQIEDMSKKRRKFITTIKKSDLAAPEVKAKVESKYDPITNQGTLDEAKALIDKDINEALQLVNDPGAPSALSNATAQLLIIKAQNEGNFEEAIRIVEHTAERATGAGQAIQALSMWNRLTPEGVLKYAESVVRRARKEMKQPERIDYFIRKGKDLSPEEQQKLADKLGVPHIGPIVNKVLFEMAKKIQIMPDGREKDIETALMLRKIAMQVPPDLGKKLAMFQTMAQLLNPKTIMRNVLGNVGFAVQENISDVFGTALDIATSLFTGKRTQYTPNIKTQLEGFAKGLKEGSQEARLGINLKNVGTRFDLPKHGVFDKGVLGSLEKTLGLVLQAPDRASYQAAFNESIRNQMVGQNLEEPTAEMIERAHHEGLYRTFQDENVVSKTFVKLKKVLNAGKSFGLGDIVLKYPFTPANLLARGIEYSPFGFIQSVLKLSDPLLHKKFDQAGFVKATSRAGTGTALMVGMGAILAALGIITGKRSSDRDVESTRQASGLREYQLNLSALKRFAASGFDPDQAKLQEGDTLASYDWLLPASISLSMGANMYYGRKGKPVVDQVLDIVDKLGEATGTIADQPMVQGVQKLAKGENIFKGVIDIGKDIPASFVPTILSQIRQLTDNVARNTKDPNYFKEMFNKAAYRVPGLASTLPPRVTTLGKDQEMYQEGTNNPFNVFLNPAFVSKYKPDPVSRMVLDIWNRTGETIQFPRQAQAKIKLGVAGEVELSADEYVEFQRYIGQRTDILFSILSQKASFMALDDSEKAKKLQGYLTDIYQAGKIEVLGYRPKRVPEDVKSVLRMIVEDKKQIDSSGDLGFEPAGEDVGFVPQK